MLSFLSIKKLFFIPRWRGLIYHLRSKNNTSWKAVIYKPIRFSVERISWGKGFFVFKHSRIEAVEKYEGVTFTPEILFGDYVTIQQNCHITCAERIEIESNTAIASNVTITDIDHPYEDINIPIEKQQLKTKSVKIGKDCKIYNNAVILQGTIIGNHCVVGANSVVKGTFPDNSVIAGCPARIIKNYDCTLNSWISKMISDHDFYKIIS